MEVLCSILRLPDVPEQTLPKLCSSILAPSLDLSYSTATTLIKSLLLKKVHRWKWCNARRCVWYWQDNVLLCRQVLSLSEPASRCLVTAVTSLCSRCPRPMCHALIGPVLEEKNIGKERVYQHCILQECQLISYRAAVLLLAYIACPGSSSYKQNRCFDVMKGWAMTLFLTSQITWSSTVFRTLFCCQGIHRLSCWTDW